MVNFLKGIAEKNPIWDYKKVDKGEIEEFSLKTGQSRLISKLLLLRGIKDDRELKHYLYDDIFSLFNPFLFSGMEKAVMRVRKSINEKEKILIFGDRDVDGVLSTAMLYNTLTRFDTDVLYRVPEGEYGYGIEKSDISFALDRGVRLIITVDTGISAEGEIDYSNSLGIDTIIIDHHVPPDNIPEAYAIINPKMESETYPNKDLSAGGVLLKFIHAFIFSYTKNFNKVFVPVVPVGDKLTGAKIRNGLIEEYISLDKDFQYPLRDDWSIVMEKGRELPEFFINWLRKNMVNQISLVNLKPYDTIEDFARIFVELFLKKQRKCIGFVKSFIDLSAITIVSDLMPLTGENRIIVKEGLKQIKNTTNLGLRVLLDYCGLSERGITAKDISWGISPLINSAGRMGEAYKAVNLFTAEDLLFANHLSKLLIDLNEKRKDKGERNLKVIQPIVESDCSNDPIIILSTDKAEHGVTGIIAQKIAKKFSKPAIIIIREGNLGIGSGRGIDNFDLVSLVSRCRDLLVRYGGHRSAIGFTIAMENLDAFRRRLIKIFQEEFEVSEHGETLEIDEILSPEDITFEFLEELNIFEPTGLGNRTPIFSIMNTGVINPYLIVKDKNHIKFYISTKSGTLQAIGWGLAEKSFKIVEKNETLDIVFSIEENNFRGERAIQLILQDLRPH